MNDSSKMVQQFGLFMPLVNFANILFEETPQDKVYPRLDETVLSSDIAHVRAS